MAELGREDEYEDTENTEIGEGWASASLEPESGAFHWLHINNGDPVGLTLGPHAPIWYWGHWYAGRMRRCSGRDCEICKAGVGRQRRWVFAVYVRKEKRGYVWETSESTSNAIQALVEKEGFMLNLDLFVKRDGAGKRGKLQITSYGKNSLYDGEHVEIPHPKTALLATWMGMENSNNGKAEESEY